MYDLIIIGGGPAACAAAVYALDKHLDVLVIAEDIGGKVGLSRMNLGQPSLAWEISEQAARLFERAFSKQPEHMLRGRVIDVNKVNGHFEVTTQQRDVRTTRTVIVASGVSPLTLDVPGARQWLGYGLGYSATTYAHLLDNKTVVVIGATQRALRGAAELARTAAQVYVVMPEASAGAKHLLAHLDQCPNVSLLYDYRVTALMGENHVERVSIARGDEEGFIPANAVFADLGLIPHSEMVRRITPVDRDGFVIVDALHATKVPGLFAAGDVSTLFSEQITVALGDGTRAAASAYDYLLTQPVSTRLPMIYGHKGSSS